MNAIKKKPSSLPLDSRKGTLRAHLILVRCYRIKSFVSLAFLFYFCLHFTSVVAIKQPQQKQFIAEKKANLAHSSRLQSTIVEKPQCQEPETSSHMASIAKAQKGLIQFMYNCLGLLFLLFCTSEFPT